MSVILHRQNDRSSVQSKNMEHNVSANNHHVYYARVGACYFNHILQLKNVLPPLQRYTQVEPTA
jgi:hypothetical protein